jgi:hypothetical protein
MERGKRRVAARSDRESKRARHCEERSDEAIQGAKGVLRSLDRFAIARPEGRASFDALWLAMTGV